MTDSLLDQALRFCNVALLEMCDTPVRRNLQARLGVLERASWSLSLMPATAEQVVSIAKLILALRDDVTRAQAENERFARLRPGSIFAADTPRPRPTTEAAGGRALRSRARTNAVRSAHADESEEPTWRWERTGSKMLLPVLP